MNIVLEICVIAVAIGLTMLVATPGHSHSNNLPLAIAIVTAWGAAIGGLFGRTPMMIGAGIGLALIFVMLALMARGIGE